MIWICLAIPTVLFLAIKEILFQPEQTSGRIVPIRRDQELERNRLRKLRDQEGQQLHLIAGPALDKPAVSAILKS